MKNTSLLNQTALLGFAWLVSCLPLAAEMRAFTDTSGRTIRGELVTVTGDFVTIKRESDGQNFTVKAGGFSDADITYFKAHGLKSVAQPVTGGTGGTGGTPATNAPLRLDVKVISGKTEKQGKYYYLKTQKIAYKVQIKNTEAKRDMDKSHGTIVIFGRRPQTNDDLQVLGKEEFDTGVKSMGTFTYDTQKPMTLTYDAEENNSLRAFGFIFVLNDASGKVINVTASSETLAKCDENAVKLQVADHCDKNCKFVKKGTLPYSYD